MRLAKLTGVTTLIILLVGVQSAQAELLALYEGDIINTPAESVALDSSGNGNHGAFQGSAGLTSDGHTGGALNFNADRSHMILNTSTDGAFDSIFDTQGFSIGFWMAGGDTNPRDSSVFWADGVTPDGGNRAIQSHATWSNSVIYIDIGGCCSGSQRLQGALDEEFVKGSVGEEWTHIAYTLDPDFGDVSIYVNGELFLERFGPTDEVPPFDQFYIASDNAEGNQWEGRLDDFFITDDLIDEDGINDIIQNGARGFFNITSDPAEYTPVGGDLGLVDLDDDPSKLTLGGHATIDGGIDSWRVEQIFRTTAAGEEVIATADLSSAGVAGDGNIGAVGGDVALGTVNITNDGADDDTVEFRIFATSSADPILGFGESSLTQSFTLTGSGGGAIDPFVLLGDLTQDGTIGFADFLILSANFGLVKEPAPAASVPEPSSALLLLIGGLALLRRRRR